MTANRKAHRAPASAHQRARLKIRRLRVALGVVLATTTLTLQPGLNALQKVRGTGELHLVGVSSPTTFFSQDGHVHGLQFELAQQFASELGVKLVIDPVDGPDDVLGNLRRDNAKLALTSLSAGDPELKRLRITMPVLATRQALIQRQDMTPPASLEDLGRRSVGVLAGSPEARYFASLKQQQPDLKVVVFPRADLLDLLNLLEQGRIDFAAAAVEDFDAYRSVFPTLNDTLRLDRIDNVAWVFMKSSDRSLYDAAQDFLVRKAADGTLDRLAAFYSPGEAFAGNSIQHFQKDIAQRLPRYRDSFEQQAARQGLDWPLLAAIAYQESHWDARAVSPTGVQGLMMLTAGTADMMGVKNRAHARDSIQGGASYFKRILDRIPATVPEPDRTWMALAAYNMGPGHVMEARKLTRLEKGNPNSWLDVSRHLVQLAQARRAAGKPAPDVGQALHYVQQVRRYYDAIALNNSRERDISRFARIDTGSGNVR